MTRRKALSNARDVAEFWNLNYPVGTPVNHTTSRQPNAVHYTRSEMIVENGVPCVSIGSRRGRVPLNSLRVVTAMTQGAG